MTSCGTPAADANLCASLSYDKPDPGFETRWTHDEKVWAVAFNDKLAKFCR